MCHLRPVISLLIFSLDDLSIDVYGMLKSPTISVLLTISLFVCEYFLYTEVLLRWVHMYL